MNILIGLYVVLFASCRLVIECAYDIFYSLVRGVTWSRVSDERNVRWRLSGFIGLRVRRCPGFVVDLIGLRCRIALASAICKNSDIRTALTECARVCVMDMDMDLIVSPIVG